MKWRDVQIDVTTATAFVIGVLATGRLARLIVDDDWPITVWFREWYIDRLTKGNGWSELVVCAFCVAPWIALPNLLLAWGSGLAWYWWLPNLWLATAYLAGMIVARDIPAD